MAGGEFRGGRGKKLIEVWEWRADPDREARHEAARKFGKPVPDPPILKEENEDAWDLYQATGTQWRTSFAGAIGLDYTALYRVAETLEIEITPGLLTKIRALESAMLKKGRKEQ